MEFKSNRLRFLEWNKEDLNLFESIFTNEQVMRYAFLQQFHSRKEVLTYFNEVLDNNKTIDNRKAYGYAVFLESDHTFIGFADIEVYLKNQFGGHGEIGYFLLPDFWGSGYATEIASMLLEIGFGHIKLHRLCASCNIENKNSERIMLKIGMKKEGVMRQVRYKNERWYDELRYSILEEEWKLKM
jgi:RimJ/RimL family protein N-acetyltransferase